MSLPILPDVLAYHVCPFLHNKEQASMLQLCHAVRRDLIKRGADSLVKYYIPYNSLHAETLFAQMRRRGTRHLTIEYTGGRLADLVTLTALREIRIRYNSSMSKHLPSVCSSYMPPSLEKLWIIDLRLFGSMVFDLGHTPKLQLLHIDAQNVYVDIIIPSPPQYMADFKLRSYKLAILRDSAANLMSAPNFEHFDIDLYIDNGDIVAKFDNLDAPTLKTFASRCINDVLNYDLRAPQLHTLTHSSHSCLPRSAPNITHLKTSCTDLAQYAHLTKLTHLSMSIEWWTRLENYIIAIPLELEELEEFCIVYNLIGNPNVKLDSRIPKGLKRIKVPKVCTLTYTATATTVNSCEIVRTD
jgi:hypothetical protein